MTGVLLLQLRGVLNPPLPSDNGLVVEEGGVLPLGMVVSSSHLIVPQGRIIRMGALQWEATGVAEGTANHAQSPQTTKSW